MKEQKTDNNINEVNRRAFLKHSTHLIVGGCALASVGCGNSDDDNDGMIPIRPDNRTGPGSRQQPSPPPEPHPLQDEPEDPLAGIEVKIQNDLKRVSGSQKIDDRKVLNALRTKDPILLVRVDNNTIVANTIICTHQGCQVAYDKKEKRLECPCHHSHFDLAGKVIQGPARRSLKHFEATIEGNLVLLKKA